MILADHRQRKRSKHYQSIIKIGIIYLNKNLVHELSLTLFYNLQNTIDYRTANDDDDDDDDDDDKNKVGQ